MKSEIKKIAAVSGTIVLAAIIAFCPLLVCAPPDLSAADSCCPHSHHSHGPLPCDSAGPGCPYVLLEKAKFVAPPLVLPSLQVTVIAPVVVRHEMVTMVPTHILAVEDLYLRNRVLLI